MLHDIQSFSYNPKSVEVKPTVLAVSTLYHWHSVSKFFPPLKSNSQRKTSTGCDLIFDRISRYKVMHFVVMPLWSRFHDVKFDHAAPALFPAKNDLNGFDERVDFPGSELLISETGRHFDTSRLWNSRRSASGPNVIFGDWRMDQIPYDTLLNQVSPKSRAHNYYWNKSYTQTV